MQGRIRTLTTFKTGDPVQDRFQEHVKQTVQPALDNPVLNATDFRWAEVAGADPSKASTFVLQYRSTGTTWTTVLTVDSTGQIVQPTWTAPTLLNSWVNFGAPWEVAGYYKDSVGIVHLRGLLKNGTIPAAMFTLPSGYRPANGHAFSIVSNSAFAQCNVNPDGTVVAQNGSNASFSLSGITFDTRS